MESVRTRRQDSITVDGVGRAPPHRLRQLVGPVDRADL
jgi:hypothetical protein